MHVGLMMVGLLTLNRKSSSLQYAEVALCNELILAMVAVTYHRRVRFKLMSCDSSHDLGVLTPPCVQVYANYCIRKGQAQLMLEEVLPDHLACIETDVFCTTMPSFLIADGTA